MSTLGRSDPGESWKRAMEEVERRLAEGSGRRYRVYGRRIDEGWWAYHVGSVKPPPPPARASVPMSRARIAEMSRTLPRCAQRARQRHGGETKVAWPDRKTAEAVARFLGAKAYQCQLPAPAIGEHWHTYTSKKGKRWM